ncbi:MAG: hypothetical protein A2V74_04715 [Acidobacteria bacterium RBG_16_70_10]|nr:MAG: hypothetical protein A2V74_04715 [Acidobacteria bacterium RBG_16_70_10]
MREEEEQRGTGEEEAENVHRSRPSVAAREKDREAEESREGEIRPAGHEAEVRVPDDGAQLGKVR